MTTSKPSMKPARILRKPYSKPTWNRADVVATDIKVLSTIEKGRRKFPQKQFCFEFEVNSSKSEFRVEIDVENYDAILRAMGDVDREATLLAAASVVKELSTAIKGERDAAAKEKQDAARQQKTAKLASISIPRF